jgi:hypothetical protein
MSNLFSDASSIISAPFSMGSNLLGGIFGGSGSGGLLGGIFGGGSGSGGLLSSLESALGGGLLTTLEPFIFLFIGVEVMFKLIDKI